MSCAPRLLGVDLGTTRLRVVCIEAHRAGISVAATLSREVAGADDETQAAALREMFVEAGARRAHCAIAASDPAARLLMVHFAPMSGRERVRAARFEALRLGADQAGDVVALAGRPLPGRPHAYALGIANRAALDRSVRLVRRAGGRVVAVDSAGLALARAVHPCDAAIDIGLLHTSIFVYGGAVPFVCRLEGGGWGMTLALADDLRIDPESAEQRKRIAGAAGAAGDAIREFAAACGRAFAAARARGYPPVRRIALAGNGARLPEIAPALCAVLHAQAAVATPPSLLPCGYPPDILRATFPDWALAFGLAQFALERAA